MPGFLIADIKAEICDIEGYSPGSKGKEITGSSSDTSVTVSGNNDSWERSADVKDG
jgi:hypothetical protein